MADSRYQNLDPVYGEFLYKLDPDTKRKKILRFYPDLQYHNLSEEALDGIELTEVPFKATDTLMGLSQKYYDDPAYWWVIALVNNVGCEQDILLGQTIVILRPLTTVLPELGL